MQSFLQDLLRGLQDAVIPKPPTLRVTHASASLGAGVAIPFDGIGFQYGIAFTAGGTKITIGAAGVYGIDASVDTGTCQIRKNGTTVISATSAVVTDQERLDEGDYIELLTVGGGTIVARLSLTRLGPIGEGGA